MQAKVAIPAVRPFPLTPTPIRVPDEQLADLSTRLKAVRWPVDAGNDDWYYGVGKAYLKELVDYWIDGYDWRKAEAAINAYEQYQIHIDGVPVHFMRKAGTGANPTPLILTHGWPWTFWHWSKVIDQLADPAAFGGDPADAFDVIVPSFPGFGFSGPLPDNPDMNFWKIADLWHTLMTGILGYEKYAAGGCDMGGSSPPSSATSTPTSSMPSTSAPAPTHMFTGHRAWDVPGGRTIPDGVPEDIRAGLVASSAASPPTSPSTSSTASTLAYGLSDSPAGMLAWLLERWAAWTDNDGDVENVFTKDDLLTQATIYWVTNTIGTSMRAYANANRYPWQPSHDRHPRVQAPTGITFVGYENPPGVTTANRVQDFIDGPIAPWFNHVNVTAHPRGGHFIPWEIPGGWVDDLRRTFRGRRPAANHPAR